MFRWYYTAGMVAFVFSAYLAVLYLAIMLLYWNGSGSLAKFTVLCLLGLVGFILHPFFPLELVVVSLTYWGDELQDSSRERKRSGDWRLSHL